MDRDVISGLSCHFVCLRALHDHDRRVRIPAVPGRGCRTSEPDGAFGLFRDRYFPARADLERFGCLRQAALRGDCRARTDRGRNAAGNPYRAEQAGRYARRDRQRHRHGPPGADRQSRHHCPLRHQVVPVPPHRGQGRRRPDRPVRRRLLRGVHGGRSHHRHLAAGGVGPGLRVVVLGRQRISRSRQAAKRMPPASRVAPRSCCT